MSIHDDARAASEKVYDDEMQRLTTEATAVAEQLVRVTLDRDRIATALAASEDELTAARAEYDAKLAARDLDVAESRARVAEAERTIVQLRARIAELEAGAPDPEPEPEPAKVTRFGSCPIAPGGESLAAARTVTTKWGDDACVRQFKGDFSPPNTVGSLMHTSYKPDITDLLAGRLDSQIAAVVNACRPGDVLEVWHEADKKAKEGLDTYERYVAAKNYFYDKVKAIRDDVLVANTVTGWLLEPTRSGVDWQRWGAVKADILGVDCDGIHPTKLPYTDYRGETERARAFIEQFKGNGYRWYAVPEYGSNRIPSDASGTERAKAYTQHGQMWAADPLCLYVALYEYDQSSSFTYRLTTPSEVEAWRALIGA